MNLFALIFFSWSTIAHAEDFVPVTSAIRSQIASGFYPIGGNAEISATELSTYVGGGSIELFTFRDDDINGFGASVERDTTLVSLGGYLLGLNWAALTQAPGKSAFLNYGEVRVGPHVKTVMEIANGVRIQRGFEVGYGLVLVGTDKNGNLNQEARFLHGVEMAATLTWGD